MVNGRMRRSGESAGTPARPSSRLSERMEIHIDSFARALLLEPRRAPMFFWALGVIAVLFTIPFAHWSTKELVTIYVVVAMGMVAFITRFIARRSSPFWTLHIDVALGTVLVSALSWAGMTRGIGFVNLYYWVVLFSAVYFRPVSVALHMIFLGMCYALVLNVGASSVHPVPAWCALVGTASICALFIVGLVNMLRSSSRIDSLTGLANRRFFDERFEEEFERSRRSGEELSLALIDIDGFKIVNDRFGHEVGDRLLIDLASRWQAVTRDGGDFLGRVGGDEFAVLAPGSDELGMRRLVDRLTHAVPDGVFVSIGTATWDRVENAADLMRKSDQAMYKVKLGHRGDANYRGA